MISLDVMFRGIKNWDEHAIHNFFQPYIWRAMTGSIKVAADNNLNLLVALGLSSYTEILGGMVTGNLKVPKNAKRNYDAFLSYMGPHYVDLNKRVDIYNRVRCGLVHEYIIKGDGMVSMALQDGNHNLETMPGIFYIEPGKKVSFTGNEGTIEFQGNTIVFAIRNYLRDFEIGCSKYYDELIADSKKPEADQVRLAAFKKAIG
jgi:hypothetical protein